MRTTVRFRLAFFLVAIAVYVAGFQLIPETLDTLSQQLRFGVFAASYFVLLPVLYAYWIVHKGKQKAWKIVLILSLSCLMARFSFPTVFAEYFEFITWLRYPLIGILLIIELLFIGHIVRQLWQVRGLKGDPRVHALTAIDEADDKKRDMALLLVYEPATWYYAIPRISRNHPPAIADLKLRSASFVFWLGCITLFLLGASFSYWLLSGWSELVAALVASVIAYSVVMVTANYRVSKHYSMYVLDDKLVINNNFLNLMVIPLADIRQVETGLWSRADAVETLVLGTGEQANVRLTFSRPQNYCGLMGYFQETTDSVLMVVDEPEQLQQALDTEANQAA